MRSPDSFTPRRLAANNMTASLSGPMNVVMNEAVLTELNVEKTVIVSGDKGTIIPSSSKLRCELCCEMKRQGSPVDCGLLVRGCVC